MERNISTRLRILAAFALALSLAACSANKNQNPVASGDQVGSVSDNGSSPDGSQATTYTTKKGDTLKRIAGRPEIYGDPNLWPILQEDNAEKVGHSMRVRPGIVLTIPRDLSSEQIEMAHEKARQMASEHKMGEPQRKHEMATPQPEATAAAMPVHTPPPVSRAMSPAPVPPAQKSGVFMRVLFVLLLILAALAAVFYFFTKKDKKDGKN